MRSSFLIATSIALVGYLYITDQSRKDVEMNKFLVERILWKDVKNWSISRIKKFNLKYRNLVHINKKTVKRTVVPIISSDWKIGIWKRKNRETNFTKSQKKRILKILINFRGASRLKNKEKINVFLWKLAEEMGSLKLLLLTKVKNKKFNSRNWFEASVRKFIVTIDYFLEAYKKNENVENIILNLELIFLRF